MFISKKQVLKAFSFVSSSQLSYDLNVYQNLYCIGVIENRSWMAAMNGNYRILKERGVDFILPTWIEPMTRFDHGADAKFDSGAWMIYDCSDPVAWMVFDLGIWMLENCINRVIESSQEPTFGLKHVCWELIKDLRRERESKGEKERKKEGKENWESAYTWPTENRNPKLL